MSMNSNRRDFLKMVTLASAGCALPRAFGATTSNPHVLVIGGGFAGATLAKYLKHWGGNVDVTLVDRKAEHYSCILSNMVVTGEIPIDRIRIGYTNLRSRYGVVFTQGEAQSIDPAGKKVTVQTRRNIVDIHYDKLVLAPGVDFIAPAGNYRADLTPHAWIAGPQTLLLKNQLASMSANQTFVLTIPPSPYRCPPGPYERACGVAEYLQRNKPGAKIVVLDANPAIQAEPINFGNAFQNLYQNVLTYVPNAPVVSVDSVARTVTTPAGTFQGAVVNVIPVHRAGRIVTAAGLANDPTGRWAVVNPLTYESSANRDIHILGDSQATGQPKSGHMANAQAKVCADALIRAFNGQPPDLSPVTSSACFSPITSTKASWLTASFQYDPASKTMRRVEASFGEAAQPTSDGMQQMFQWADNIFADSFG
jgi:NADH dehydrogenase FAD-containing subunit